MTWLIPSFQTVLLVSVALRVILILYSDWHDAHSVVKYTDVDYRVFSDASRFILRPSSWNIAKGPWALALDRYLGFQVGDPYTRETYRYTPLLALLLTPNEFIHPSFGKYLFAGSDILNGVLIYLLLVDVILPSIPSEYPESKAPDNTQAQINNTPNLALTPICRATLLASLHLFNPLVFTISTRGSSESILSTFVLLTLFCALKQRWGWAAVLLGVSVHWKIYPVIYGVACLGVIGSGEGGKRDWKGWAVTIVNRRTITFGIVSGGTFLGLGCVCYAIWGYPFLHESYLYHLHRLDHRHNFSPYFYLTYLTYPSLNSSSLPLPIWRKLLRSPLISFAPQMTLAVGSGLMLGRRKDDLVFTWFVQTVLFVLFNKVCTSQYFLWYLLFLPLLLPRLSIPPRRIIAYLVVWIGTQALWLGEAYRLEFLGESVFWGLWVRSLVYVTGNGWVLGGIMNGYGR